jgi:glycosyltransferase involved in cell wall biosynthesis
VRDRLAVAIPAFEAARHVAGVVERCRAIVPEVVVVDDGSTDDTGRVAAEAGARILSHEVNQGKGRALRTAFEDLLGRGFDRVVTVDADGQHLPEEIPQLVAAHEAGADLVIGTRDHLFRNMSALRRFSNTASSRAISTVAGLRLRDVQSGFRLYTAHLVRSTGFPEARFSAESAVVVRAARRGLRIVGVPIRLAVVDGRGTSHYRPLVDSLRIFAAVTQARFERISR